MATLEARLTALEKRLRMVEDERDIAKVIIRYGFAVDTGDAKATGALYAADTLVDVDGKPAMKGRKGVEAMVLGEPHQRMLPNCAHTMAPFVIEVRGDRAVATGYMRVYWRQGENISLWRLSVNRWELVRKKSGWEVARRWSTRIGSERYQQLLHRGLETSKIKR
ncbi:MAG: nuclear transport factor 2 family protein [Chloroflexi bacterium]|nr:nuclear transport factor 2 family protein [Chloroflexota bacterium]